MERVLSIIKKREISIKEIGNKIKNMVGECISTAQETLMKETSGKDLNLVRGFTSGVQGSSMMENSWVIRCMVKECWLLKEKKEK